MARSQYIYVVTNVQVENGPARAFTVKYEAQDWLRKQYLDGLEVHTFKHSVFHTVVTAKVFLGGV